VFSWTGKKLIGGVIAHFFLHFICLQSTSGCTWRSLTTIPRGFEAEVFYGPDALPVTQPTASKHRWKMCRMNMAVTASFTNIV